MKPEDERQFRANDGLAYLADVPDEAWPWWCEACDLGVEPHAPCPSCGREYEDA